MSDVLSFICVLCLGFIASLFGSIAGGAGMIALPGLILLGLPADCAIATNKLADLGRFLAASGKFLGSGKIVWRKVISLAPLATAAGLVGARILLHLNPRILRPGLSIVMVLLLLLNRRNHELGVREFSPSRRKLAFGYVFYSIAAVYAAVIQIGSGPLLLAILVTGFGMTMLQANATSSVCWLFLTISSLAVLGNHDIINWFYGIALTIGSSFGGYLGARTALANGDVWIKKMFTAVLLTLAALLLAS